jgi:hypothetical protein
MWMKPVSEVVLAYEIALRALDKRDLESTRLFIEIGRTLREIEPARRGLGLGLGQGLGSGLFRKKTFPQETVGLGPRR